MRNLTRRQRYDQKIKNADFIPVLLGCVSFSFDDNLAFLIRAAACFGVSELHVIGSIPHRSKLNAASGSTYDYIFLKQHSNPYVFLEYMKERNIKIISAEISKNSVSLKDYEFNFKQPICIFTGHETHGVPTEILLNSDIVKIDLPGPGFCLNTSQAANVMLYEASKQFFAKNKWREVR